MKFTVPTIALALLSSTLPLLASAAAPCNDCDEASLQTIGECTHAWVDKIVYYCQNECKVDATGLLEKCEGENEDDNPPSDNSTTTATESTTGTSTSTPTGNVKTNSTSTIPGPKSTDSGAAAAPAFGGIGFGGGAAAMVGLAGLVGLVL